MATAMRILRILVVEDEFLIAEGLNLTLQDLGHVVMIAENGERALGLFRSASQPFDFVITDLNMPVMDGYQLISALQLEPRGKGLPIVLCSGDFPKRTRDKKLKVISLPKPCSVDDIKGAIEELVTE